MTLEDEGKRALRSIEVGTQDMGTAVDYFGLGKADQ